uniref:NAC domain-containing protein n=1 Tax=Oryza meridionalis TaxID=40149 RepID=A0A0E0F619_9ORYZ
MPLPYDFITDIDILHHNPLDIVPTRQEKKNRKHFFTRKEKKHHGDNRRNNAAGIGFWRLASTEALRVYKNPVIALIK